MRILLFVSLFILFSCGSDNSDLEQHSQLYRVQSTANLDMLLKTSSELVVEVVYEPGAEPYTDKNFRNRHYWTFLESNLQAIIDLRGREVTLTVPKELADMRMIAIQDKTSWTAQEIESLVSSSNFTTATSAKGVFKVIFLKGHFKSDGVVKDKVLGINVTGTTTIAIFKDVVEEMGRERDDNIAKFAEQSTLVHEIGHAIGLVNNGVKQVANHQDTAHGAHCMNTDCVMNWQNEGATEMISFIENYFSSGSEIMFGENCLDDIKAHK
ncbi:MAG: hypothetical protein BM556_12315 [Bacteriovorax sp. MedPE-SWde]|nr:MAG: hypothetical protein BM556_12315 [Bacteriovorax sp. MedPE-SWde]